MHEHHKRGMSISFRPKQLALFLCSVVFLLTTSGFFANIVIYQVAPSPEHKLARLMHRLDLGHEPSLPAFYSSLALLASAALLAVIAIKQRREKGRFSTHWGVLSAIFVVLAIDETIMIHEMVSNYLHDALHTSGKRCRQHAAKTQSRAHFVKHSPRVT